jgi:hypothetical protein
MMVFLTCRTIGNQNNRSGHIARSTDEPAREDKQLRYVEHVEWIKEEEFCHC